MFFENQNFLNAANASLQPQYAIMSTLLQTAIINTKKIVELNIGTMKERLHDSSTSTKEILSSSSQQERLLLILDRMRENMKAGIVYSGNMADIALAMQSDILNEMEKHRSESRRHVSAAIEQMERRVPVSSEAGVTILKTTLDSFHKNVERWTNAVRQGQAISENQIKAATTQIARTVDQIGTGTTVK